MIVKKYFEFEIPVSFINDESKKFELYVKVFAVNKKEADDVIEQLYEVTKQHIDDKNINVTVASYYNELFTAVDEFFTFKARDKGSLAGNNIHIQVLQGGLNG